MNYLGKIPNTLSTAKKFKVKIIEVFNHYLACLKLINPSVHQFREGFTI
jgi:hypothetical protein